MPRKIYAIRRLQSETNAFRFLDAKINHEDPKRQSLGTAGMILSRPDEKVADQRLIDEEDRIDFPGEIMIQLCRNGALGLGLKSPWPPSFREPSARSRCTIRPWWLDRPSPIGMIVMSYIFVFRCCHPAHHPYSHTSSLFNPSA